MGRHGLLGVAAGDTEAVCLTVSGWLGAVLDRLALWRRAFALVVAVSTFIGLVVFAALGLDGESMPVTSLFLSSVVFWLVASLVYWVLDCAVLWQVLLLFVGLSAGDYLITSF